MKRKANVLMAGEWRNSLSADEAANLTDFLDKDCPPNYGLVRRMVELLDGYDVLVVELLAGEDEAE